MEARAVEKEGGADMQKNLLLIGQGDWGRQRSPWVCPWLCVQTADERLRTRPLFFRPLLPLKRLHVP